MNLKSIALFFMCFCMQIKAEEGTQNIPVTRREQRAASKAIWVQSHRQIIQTNRKYIRRLLEKQKKQQIIGFELVVASSTDLRFESKWGHSLFRFVDNLGQAENDVGLGFVADVDTPKVSYLQGLFGGYPVLPVVKSMRLYNNQYVKSENRPLDRYVLPSTKTIRNKVIDTLVKEWSDIDKKTTFVYENAIKLARKMANHKGLKKWGKDNFIVTEMSDEDSGDISAFVVQSKQMAADQDQSDVNDDDDEDESSTLSEGKPVKVEAKERPIIYPVDYSPQSIDELGGYTFLKMNCAGALVKFLKNAGLPSLKPNGIWSRLPIKLPDFYKRSLVNPFPVFKATHAVDVKNEAAKILGLTLKDFESGEKYPKEKETLLLTLSLKDKLLLLDQVNLPESYRLSLLSSLPPLNQRPSYEEMYDLKNMPALLYEVCLTKECARNQVQAADDFFGIPAVNTSLNALKKYATEISNKKKDNLFKMMPEYKTYVEQLSSL